MVNQSDFCEQGEEKLRFFVVVLFVFWVQYSRVSPGIYSDSKAGQYSGKPSILNCAGL